MVRRFFSGFPGFFFDFLGFLIDFPGYLSRVLDLANTRDVELVLEHAGLLIGVVGCSQTAVSRLS